MILASSQGLIGGTWLFVRVARFVNRLFFVAVVAGLLASWPCADFFGRLLRQANPGVALPDALIGIRWLMLVGVAMATATEGLLGPLTRLVASARAGDPFAVANAPRLQAIGWALLALQLLDIPCILLARAWPSLGPAAPTGDVSVGGWLATLMAFVLARAFATGTAMRDELAGTV